MATTMSVAVIECESRIERVTVYARGALVTRRVSVPRALPRDAVDLVVPGVSALAEPGSVRAGVEGAREVVGLRARYVVPSAPAVPVGSAERVRDLDLERRRLEEVLHVVRARRGAMAAPDVDAGLPRRFGAVDASARMRDALAATSLLAETTAALDAEIRALYDALEDNARARAAALLAASQADSRERAGAGRPTLDLVVRLAAARRHGHGHGNGHDSSAHHEYDGEATLEALTLTYAIAAARWWPAYSARFTAGATRSAWSLEAFVAQRSDEDWGGVRLELSTADLVRDARLPELPSLRLSRAQPPVKRAYRPPPPGLDELFAGYDQAVARARAAAVAKQDAHAHGAVEGEEYAVTAELLEDVLEEAGSVADDAPERDAREMTRAGTIRPQSKRWLAKSDAPRDEEPMEPAPARAKSAGLGSALMSPLAAAADAAAEAFAPAPPPPPKKAAPRGGAMADTRARASVGAPASYAAPGGGGSGTSVSVQVVVDVQVAIEPADAWLDFDALALPDPSDPSRRGRLVRDALPPGRPDPGAARAMIDALPSPEYASDPLYARGQFDHAYEARGAADVPSNGAAHRVPVALADAPATPRFRAVPREAPEVYREVEVRNPFDAPLLAGPVDVFVDGALTNTSQIAAVDRGGAIFLGLGVEDRLRVARNARVSESSAGLLGGSAVVDHAVTIELASSLGVPAAVEVLDRVPVTDDKDVEVVVTGSRPRFESYTQSERGAPVRGGVRWRVEVPAGGTTQVEFGYRVTLPAKNEIVGGNRRD